MLKFLMRSRPMKDRSALKPLPLLLLLLHLMLLHDPAPAVRLLLAKEEALLRVLRRAKVLRAQGIIVAHNSEAYLMYI